MSNTQHSAAELLPQLLNDEGVLNGEGSIAFIKPDKTTARIFLRQGSIYAVDNLDYENNLWAELRFEEHISHGNLRALIRAHKSQRDSLYKLLKRTRHKLKNDDNLVITLQEYVLGAIDNIYSWDSVKVEWRMGDTFNQTAADVPPFPLQHLLTLCVNRSLFKFTKYEEWGFKNDDQFRFGSVILTGDIEGITPSSSLEQAILVSRQFVIKGLIESTGFSIFTIASCLDDLNKRVKLKIENPSGRQKPENLPPIPHDVPVVKDKVHFSATDEDPDMLKVFNTEYHVPVPALLEDASEHEISDDNKDNPEFNSYDDVINDTSTLEVLESKLPSLPKPSSEIKTVKRSLISDDELKKEEEANDIKELYKSLEKQVPKARGIVKKPMASVQTSDKEKSTSSSENTSEEVTHAPSEEDVKEVSVETTPNTPISKSEGNDMSSESPLFNLLNQVEAQLANQKVKIADHQRSISNKELALEAAKSEVSRLTMELAAEIGAKESATAEFQQARKIIESLNN